MIYYHLKLAFRNLRRHKMTSLIHIFGLTLGLSSCIMIGLYTFHELSYDTFYSQYQNIYRINKITNEHKEEEQQDGITPGQLAPELEKALPEVVHSARFRPWFNEMLISYDAIHLKLNNVAYADQGFLEVFDFPLLYGDKKTALTEPFTVVITESVARRYFNNTNPIGKTLLTLHDIPVKISGVAKDVPNNSSIQFTMLISWLTTSATSTADHFFWMNNWSTQVNFSFVQLKPHTNPIQTGAKISTLLHQYFQEDEFKYRTYLQPLSAIHLGSENLLYVGAFITNNKQVIYTLLIIAGLILLIAGFNFINLSISGALGRAKETGVQKVLGASQGQLIRKFFSESFLLCCISLCFAIILVKGLLPSFNALAKSQLSIDSLYQPRALAMLGGLLLFISLIAGLYPAIFLARFKSSDVFRNIIKAGKEGWLRKSLVTLQFTLSIMLIIATLIVQKQMHFMLTKDLGFEKEQIVVLQLANTNLENKSQSFIQSLQQSPNIINITATNGVPGQSFNGFGIVPEGRTAEEHLMANVLETDADFLKTYHIQLADGRYFSSEMPTDTTDAIVINEAMQRYLNWKEPIGKRFDIHEERQGKVIGVIKDFNVTSLRESVQPLAIVLKNNTSYLSVKIKPGTAASTLNFIEKTWKQFDPQYPFEYTFLDERLNQFYQSDSRLLRVLSIFAGLSICIACLGLLGLSTYNARQRTKEISIRKVLGASVSSIVTLLSKDFINLVLIAILIATPIGWWAMNQWLQDFAYRVDIQWWTFALAGAAAIAIAVFTVSFQAIRVAVANPVKTLRSE